MFSKELCNSPLSYLIIAVSTEHDSDKELMALVEELRDENRSIFEELEQLKSK